MGQVDHPFGFTGKVGKLTFYKRRGSDNIIVRESKGIVGKRIKTGKAFKNTRLNNMEFTGRNLFCKDLYHALDIFKPVYDHNFYNMLMQRAHKIQVADPVNNPGQRVISVSERGSWLENMAFNKKFSWESIIQAHLDVVIDKEAGKAFIQIPSLIPGLQLHNATNLPYYQFRFTLKTVADVIYRGQKYAAGFENIREKTLYTRWHRSDLPSSATDLELQTELPKEKTFTLLFAMAIAFSRVDGSNADAVQYVGAGKIARVI